MKGGRDERQKEGGREMNIRHMHKKDVVVKGGIMDAGDY